MGLPSLSQYITPPTPPRGPNPPPSLVFALPWDSGRRKSVSPMVPRRRHCLRHPTGNLHTLDGLKILCKAKAQSRAARARFFFSFRGSTGPRGVGTAAKIHAWLVWYSCGISAQSVDATTDGVLKKQLPASYGSIGEDIWSSESDTSHSVNK